jgi:hypothetical protein
LGNWTEYEWFLFSPLGVSKVTEAYDIEQGAVKSGRHCCALILGILGKASWPVLRYSKEE